MEAQGEAADTLPEVLEGGRMIGAATYELGLTCKYTLPVWTLFPWVEEERQGWLSWN